MRARTSLIRIGTIGLALVAAAVLATLGGCGESNPLLDDIEQMVEEASRGGDTVRPTVGSAIVVGTVTQTTVGLSWGAATDDRSNADDLEYMVAYASSSGALGSIDLALQAPVSLDWTAATTSHTVSGLEPVTDYWFAVLTRDEAGNTSLYTLASATTLNANAPTAGDGPSFSGIVDTQVTVSWGAATDDDTAAGELEYKLVRASSGAEIDTAAEADAITGAAVALDWTANTTSQTATGLTPLTTYAFAILVRDAANNLALYAPQTITTLGAAMTVTFDPQGGTTPEPQTKTVCYGSTYGSLATTLRAGYTFEGWWTGTGGSGTQVTVDTVVSETGDHALYAAWEELPWASTVTGGGDQSWFKDVVADSSESVYAVGYQEGTGTFDYGNDQTATGDHSIKNVVIVKYAAGGPQWARSVSNGKDESEYNRVAVDSSGNVYAVGYQAGEGTFNYGNGKTATGTYDGTNVVIVKYDSTGTAQWARTVSGGGADSGYSGVAVDSSGNVYAVGRQEGTGSFNYGNSQTATGTYAGTNVVIVKYDSTGTAQWARSVSGGGAVSGYSGVAVDSAGNIYASGFQVGTGTFSYGNSKTATGDFGGANAVIVKYDSSGAPQWAETVLDGGDSSLYYDVAVDSSGNVYASGVQFGTETFSYGNSKTATAGYDGTNVVIVKYDSTGTAQWARTVSGDAAPSAYYGVCVDSSGFVYAGGYQKNKVTFDYGAGRTATGDYDGYNVVIVKYDSAGTAQWARTVSGGGDASYYYGVAVDSSGNVYAGGYQDGTGSFSYGTGQTATGDHSGSNAVIVKYLE